MIISPLPELFLSSQILIDFLIYHINFHLQIIWGIGLLHHPYPQTYQNFQLICNLPHLDPLPHQLPPFHPHHKMTFFHHKNPLSLISKPLKRYHITTFLIAVGCHRNLMMLCCRGRRWSHGKNVVLHHSHFLNSHPRSPHPQLFYLGLCRFTPHDHNHTFTPFISSKCHW